MTIAFEEHVAAALADMAEHVAICRRPGCENCDVPITVLASRTAPIVVCGACAEDGENTPITDLTLLED